MSPLSCPRTFGMLLSENHALIAAAGSRKTEHVIESALRVVDEPVLVVTYTLENQRQIVQRIHQKVGLRPPNIAVMGWFGFLMREGARPYQRALTGKPGAIRGLNFRGRRDRYTPRKDVRHFYFDGEFNMLRDGVSDFVWHLNKETDGSVVNRIERIYRHIVIDEVQDLVGYDLDVVDLLFGSIVKVTVVGDPRQQIIETNLGTKHRKYRGAGLLDWFNARKSVCRVETRSVNYRCNQQICDFADGIFPDLPKTVSKVTEKTGHDGIFRVPEVEARAYVEKYQPAVLRYNKRAETMGLGGVNIGLAKGSTFHRVLVFPTRPMLQFLEDGNAKKLASREHLHVAVTRARHSVAFVVPR